ncbi:hypothetical protein JCM11641_003416 [Rhodosporidiobolus odoratus]
MLETVRSRQIYGFAVITILPACAVAGYYLRTREDARIATSAAAAVSGETIPETRGVDEKAVRGRIAALKRRERELEEEAKELRVKLERAQKTREGHKI